MRYKYLDSFLENHFIPNNLLYRQIPSENEYMEYEKYINLYRVAGLKISDEEKNYVIDFLKERGIVVKGRTNSLNFESEGYIDTKNYSGGNLKEFSKEETEEKLKLYQKTKDKELRNEIVEGNMRLVSHILTKIPWDYDVNVYDLRQAGYLGLMQAVERYNPEKGAFSTFAVSYITGYIKDEMHNLQGIKSTDLQIYKVMKDIEKELGESIKDNPSLARTVVDKIIDKGIKSEIYKEENLRRVMFLNTLSLEEILENNEEEEFYNLGYTASDDEFDHIYEEERFNTIRREIEKLSDKKKKMLELRFGLNNNETHTFAELGEEFGMSGFGANLCVKSSCKELSENEEVRKLR